MQKIEKWRLEELALVLHDLSELLRKGDNCEWANVFFHFHDESQKIISKKEFDLHLLKRLIQNIKNCFAGVSSLRNLVLWHMNSRENSKVNQDFKHSRARLLKILDDIEQRTIEYIN
jgi:hypothetical protein